MLPMAPAVGRIGKNITVGTTGYVAGQPLLLTLICSKYIAGKQGEDGQEVNESWLIKLWPTTEVSFHSLCRRLHVGALVQVFGEFRTGSYLNPNTQEYTNNPYIAVKDFSVLAQSPTFKAAQAQRYAEQPDPYAHQNFPNANQPATRNDMERMPEPVTRGSATRKQPILPKVERPVVPATPKYDLDDDLPF